MIWSTWGRPHADVVAILRSLASRAARRRGLVASSDLLADVNLRLALCIQARAARMVHKCIRACEDADDSLGP